MGEARIEDDRNRFSNSERLIVELSLLAYIFAFFPQEVHAVVAFVWILIALFGGIVSYFLFSKRDYSIGLGIGLALSLTMLVLFAGVPLMSGWFIFLFALWRIQGNFNGSRIHGWPFLFVNTFVFVILTVLVRLLFPMDNPGVRIQEQVVIYLVITFLYFFVRMLTIWSNSRKLANFKLVDANRIFFSIIGLGSAVFALIAFGLKPVRLGLFMLMGFLFNGLFTLFGKATSPLVEYINREATKIQEELEVESGAVDFEMQEKAKVFGGDGSLFEYVMFAGVAALLIVATIYLLRRKRQNRHIEKKEAYTFISKGKKRNKTVHRQLTYDYSIARDVVRQAFESFELEAKKYNFSRFQGETVSEWFARMGWKQEVLVVTLYNDVRYGAYIPSELEQNTFLQALEKIKENFFTK